MCGQATLFVPAQFFAGEPAHALDKGALDLADVDRRIDRVAGVVQDVGAQQLPFASQCVDDHFGHRSAVGEVVKRAALHLVAIPTQSRRLVEPVGPELYPVLVGLNHQFREACLASFPAHAVISELDPGCLGIVQISHQTRQSVAHLARGVLRRLAVQIAAGRRRRGRGIGNLAGVVGGRAHARNANTELQRNHLRHLGVQSLAHLGATVVDQHTAVGIDVHQSTGLVEVHHVEGNAEFERCQREALAQYQAIAVEFRDRGAPGLVIAAGLELGYQFVYDIVAHCLAVWRGVALVLAIKVELAQFEWIHAQLARDIVNNVFDRNRALRPAETTEGGIRLGVGLDTVGVDGDVAEVIGIVEMTDRACDHRASQVGGKPCLRGHLDMGRMDQAIVVVADVIGKFETVTLAGNRHVVVAIET